MNKRFILLSLLTLATSTCFATEQNDTAAKKTFVMWDKTTHAFSIGKTQIKVGYDMQCGYYENQAEFASFGLEVQIYKCAKIVIPVTITQGPLSGHIDFAPLYDSIKSENPSTVVIYDKDAQGHNIQGNNPYFDWYKNLGSRLYYLGDAPIIEAYVSYQFNAHHQLIAGRLKTHTGLADKETPWSDDGMFSPYAYWLSRDLYSGLRYQFTSRYLNVTGDFLSGNNPMKSYANYLDHIQSPNLKANNTYSWGINANFNLGHLINTNNNSQITIGILQNTINSTWVAALNDGKRRNSIYAAAMMIDWPLNQNWSADLFGQYSRYLSGLTTDSIQRPRNILKNMTQNGYFAGTTLQYKALSISYTYEIFDRFDANIYQFWLSNPTNFNGLNLAELERLKQRSHIINIRYQINPYIAIEANYQSIDNPTRWVSSILNTYPDYRLNAAIHLSF